MAAITPAPSPLSVAVVVPTVNRPESLGRLLDSLDQQTLSPTSVVISVPATGFVPEHIRDRRGVTVVESAPGASIQRNTAIVALDPSPDVVAFFDDDAIVDSRYLEQAISFLQQHPNHVALTGRVVCDGAAEKRQLTPSEILTAVEEAARTPLGQAEWSSTTQLYGCNMVVRHEALRATMFDPRLPLYSWLEDLDLSRRLTPHGQLARVPDCLAVHEGSSSGGRTQHRRFGYSQIANPAYLHAKGTITARDVVHLVGRPSVANILGCVGRDSAWRRQRLTGELLAVRDILLRRASPERIVDL